MSWCKSVEKFNSGNKICKYSSACVWKSPRFNVAFVQLENLVKIRQIDFNRSKKFATQSVTSHAVARYLLAWCWTSSRLEWWSTRGACGPGRAQPPGGWPGFRGFCCSGFPLLTCCLGPPGLEEAATVVVSQPSEWVGESEWMNAPSPGRSPLYCCTRGWQTVPKQVGRGGASSQQPPAKTHAVGKWGGGEQPARRQWLAESRRVSQLVWNCLRQFSGQESVN